jgi:hypothetical protein
MSIHVFGPDHRTQSRKTGELHLVKPPSRTLPDRLRRHPFHTILSVLLDIAASSLAVGVALIWGAGSAAQAHVGWLPALFVPIVIALLASRLAYRRSLSREFLDEIGPLQSAIAARRAQTR